MSRVLSAAALVAVLAATVWILPPWATIALASLAAALAAGELAALTSHLGGSPSVTFVGLASAICCAAFALSGDRGLASASDLLGVVLVAAVLALGLVALASGPPTSASLTQPAVAALAIVYIGLPLGTAAWLRVALGPAVLTWLVAVVALSDSAQYYTGRLFGRRKLAPLVSPAKTIEGAVGGLVVAAIAGAALARPLLPAGISTALATILAVLLAGFGIAGDLFESLLKRSVGVKDSSTLIPGHGGVLDRIDAYLFAAPAFYLFLRFVA